MAGGTHLASDVLAAPAEAGAAQPTLGGELRASPASFGLSAAGVTSRNHPRTISDPRRNLTAKGIAEPHRKTPTRHRKCRGKSPRSAYGCATFHSVMRRFTDANSSFTRVWS